jgi:capsular exopolysaccharide synthesis family protein
MISPAPNGNGRATQPRRIDLRQAVRERPWLAIGGPAVLVPLTILFVLLVRPSYESSASLRIDEERSGIATLEILSTLSGGSEVFTEMAVIRSRSVAEDVVRALDLQVDLAAPKRVLRSAVIAGATVDERAPQAAYVFERTGAGTFRARGEIVRRRDQPAPFERADREERDFGEARVGQPVQLEGVTLTLAPGAEEHESLVVTVAPFGAAVESLQANLAVSRPDREADVVLVRYRGADPEVVQEVPNAVAAHFLARRQQAQSAEARGTVTFLNEQIGALELQLADAEESLRGFRETNQIVSVEAEAEAQVDRLATLQARRDLLLAEREALGVLLTEVRGEATGADGVSPYRKLMSFPTLLSNTATAELLGQLAGIENERSQMLMTRTPDDRDIRILDARIQAIENGLRTMAETYWRGLSDQVASLGQGLAGFESELARIPAEQMTYARLFRRSEVLSDLYILLQTKQKESEIAAAVEDQSVRIVDPAPYPTEPVRPKPWLSVMVALGVGLLVGIGAAVAAEHLDRTVRDRGGLQAATGTTVLGLIPMIPALAHAGGPRFRWPTRNGGHKAAPRRLVGQLSAGDPATEAYRSLRTNINFARPSSPPKALVFTSPMPGDGKSTTAANMALVLAQQGGRVILVDADMRRGVLHEMFGHRSEPGLADVLIGATPAAEAMRTIPLDGGRALDFIAAGTRPPNPAELLSSEAMIRFLREMGERYDAIVFDAPPLNLVTDAALLGTLADGVVLVARAGVTEEEPLQFAIDQIERVRAPLLGTVLNGVDERRQAYYGGGAHGYFDRR